MKFPQASDGIKNIYLGVLFYLIAAGIGALASLLSLIFGDEGGVLAVLFVIMSVSVILLLIANFVFQLIGTFKNKDVDINFLYAFICLIVTLAVSILNLIVSSSVANAVFSVVGTAASVLTVYFVLTALINLFNADSVEGYAEEAIKTRLIVMICLIVAGVLSVAQVFMRTAELRVVHNILYLIESLATLAGIIIYFLFLKKVNDNLVEAQTVKEEKEEVAE